MKILRWIAGAVAVTVAMAAPVGALTATQEGAISQNCSTIRKSLKTLQRADSKTRVYLGTTYETLLNNFIMPLNLRLTRDNRPNLTLTNLQTDYVEERTDFAQNFIKYSQNLEELINVDCVNDPTGFYKKLETTRKLRSEVEKSVTKMKKLIGMQFATVKTLKENL